MPDSSADSLSNSSPTLGKPVRGSSTGRPIMVILDLLGRRWTLRILWELRHGEAMSFRELQTACGDISPTSLNKRLGELRDNAIVALIDNEGYQLTEIGQQLLQTLSPLHEWTQDWVAVMEQSSDADSD